MNDFLGNKIKIGMRAIRVHSYAHNKEFKKVEVVAIDTDRRWDDSVAVITDGNTKPGWTYPYRLIMETAFKEKI